MALPYTQSPLGSLLESLGQGIPALAQSHRQRDLQDAALAMQQREAESQLKTQGLQQQLLQGRVTQAPIDTARESYDFASKVDPLGSVILQRPLLKQAGIDLPDGYVPPDKAAAIQRQDLMTKMLAGMSGGAQNAPAQGPAGPQGAGPQDSQQLQLTPTEMFRFLQSGQFPASTAQEDAAKKRAEMTAGIQVNQEMGKLPEADTKFVDDAMTYYSQLQNAQRAINNPAVQKGGMPNMQLERFKYKVGLGNSAPYDQIIPTLDMGKQQILSDLAGGIRNAKVRAEIGTHLPGSEQSPAALTQRLENIVKYYPYMVYSKYAARGARMPEAVMKGMGFPDANTFNTYIQSIEATKPDSVGAGAVMPTTARPQAQNAPQAAGQDPLIAKYATQFGLTYQQAAQRAAASGYGK